MFIVVLLAAWFRAPALAAQSIFVADKPHTLCRTHARPPIAGRGEKFELANISPNPLQRGLET
jgi:hypothetical protein